MIRGIFQNTSSMLLLESRVDNIANNIANVNTPGYKKREVFFEQLIAAEHTLEKDLMKVQLPDGYIATYTDTGDGRMNKTDNPLDIAISGDGYFTVQTPEGQAYTRDGKFTLDQNGLLVTQQGHLVTGEGGPIEIKGSKVEIGSAGEIIVDGVIVNRFAIQNFDINNAEMRNNLYITNETPQQVASGEFSVMQGYIEESNVEIVKEMTELIAAQRHYEVNSRLIRAQDDTLSKTVNQVGK